METRLRMGQGAGGIRTEALLADNNGERGTCPRKRRDPSWVDRRATSSRRPLASRCWTPASRSRPYTVNRELGHTSTAMVESVCSHLG
jgi:hypothetical protein